MNYLFLFIYWFWIIMIIFFFLKHPLIMGLMLIVNTFFLSTFTLLFSFSSWNSYILFLMFLGGVLILFLYNISLISTEMFMFFKLKNMMSIFVLSIFIFKFKQSFLSEMTMYFLNKENSPMIFFFFEYNYNTILFLVAYIFLSLICIVNLVYMMKDKGSMRNMKS